MVFSGRGSRLPSILAVALGALAGVLFAGVPSKGTDPAAVSGLGPIFADGFESGDFRYWDRGVGGPPGSTLPPDPAQTAPPLDPAVAIDPYQPNKFIWEDPDPIQRDVEPGAIDSRRVCLVRGRVLDRSGAPLRAVRVTVFGAPSLGWTWTRPDGVFDLAVNGGGPVSFTFERDGFLPVAREIVAPSQDWAELEDVVMIGLDAEVTEISAGQAEMQVARGSVETDADGSRQATLLFPANLSAEMILPDGTTIPLASLNVRATEYTVGECGRRAMPADLPGNSGYTYAVELSADEAIAAGAVRVEFNEPIPVHLENFLGFPVGEPVPAGYYDRQRGEWIPAPNGRIVKILSVTAGMADLDVDGSGTPADPATLAALGISDAERARLAVLYPVGQELWRVLAPHFTPWDFNWPLGPPDDAEPPPDPEDQDEPEDEEPPPGPDADPEDGQPETPDPCLFPGSIVECENQILRESVGLVGVPYRLHYSSDRVQGRTSRSYFKLRLSGDSVPASLEAIRLRITSAGSSYSQSFDPEPDLVHQVPWNRIDRFDRPLHAEAPVTIRIEYVYRMQYYSVRSEWEASFSRLPRGDGGGGSTLPGFRSNNPLVLFREIHTTAGDLARSVTGSWDITGERLGGWSFGVHHRYSPRTRTLLLGTGERRYARDAGTVAPRFAGTGEPGDTGDGGPARMAQLESPAHLALGPDETLYIADAGAHRIRRVALDGTIETVAGSGLRCQIDGCGDGGPATAATFFGPVGIAVRPNGHLLIADYNCVREVDGAGIIETVAGFCETGGCQGCAREPRTPVAPHDLGCDDCPALDAELTEVRGLAVSPGGGFYVADAGSNRVRFVGADGIITTLAGTGGYGFSGDGGPAIAAQMRLPSGVAVAANGEVLVADTYNNRIRRIDRNGRIRTVAGTGTGGYGGDGGPATSARLFLPAQVAISRDGSFLIADELNARLRRVTPGGRIETVAGTGGAGDPAPAGAFALQVALEGPQGVAVDRSGAFYVADAWGSSVYWVGDARPVSPPGEIWIPSASGAEIFVFDERGRHLRTRNALTGATLLEFAYSTDGLLDSITDASGNATTIERDAAGDPIAIVGPYGQSTGVTLDAAGRLETLSDPAGHSWQFGYTALGLLTSATDPNLHGADYVHNGFGRLASATDAAGGHQTISRETYRSTGLSWNQVHHTSPEGRDTYFTTWEYGKGSQRWTKVVTGAGTSLTTSTRRLFDGTRIVRRPDGSVSVVQERSDPVWGALAAERGSSGFTTPGGVSAAASTASSAELADPLDPLSLVSRAETMTVNGRTYTATYEAAFRRWTMTSPEGRQRVVETDPLGRPVTMQVGDLLPVSFSFDARGRLETIRQGAGADERLVELGYDTLGRLESVTDPLLREVSFTYDDANRVELQSLPGNRNVLFGWDDKGNLTSLTPPGRPAHGFSYTPIDRTDVYSPPVLGPGTWSTDYDYALDRKPLRITRPDGLEIGFGYDVARRLETITSPRGTTEIDYDPATGQVTSLTTPEGNALTYEMDGPLLTRTTWTGEVAGSVTRTFDDDLRVSTISVNDANPITYLYDDDGLVTQAGGLVLTRDPETGFLTDTALGVVTTHYEYSPFGELESMTASVSGSPVLATSYLRDKLGRITTKVETIEGVTTTYVYGYDAAGRLDTVTIDGALAADYDYDPNGNRLQKWTPSATETGTYDDQDRMATYGDATYTYTRNGELQTKTDPDGTTTYDYDVFGNLLGVDLPDGTQIDYVVDARNRRIGRKENGAWTQKLLWQGQLSPIAELDPANSVISRFVYATRINVPDYMIRGGQTYRILHDHLGSPRLAVDTATGAIVRRIDYDEWGLVLQDTDPGWIPFGFAGGMTEERIQSVRFGYRDYEPASGRWSDTDPLRFRAGDSNLYGYALQEPINLGDPYGLQVGTLFCHALRPVLKKSAQEAGVAGRLSDALLSAGMDAYGVDARAYAPAAVDVALDAQRVGGGLAARTIATALVVGGTASAFTAIVAGGFAFVGGWEVGRGLDQLYQDLGGKPLSDYFVEWWFDPEKGSAPLDEGPLDQEQVPCDGSPC